MHLSGKTDTQDFWPARDIQRGSPGLHYRRPPVLRVLFRPARLGRQNRVLGGSQTENFSSGRIDDHFDTGSAKIDAKQSAHAVEVVVELVAE